MRIYWDTREKEYTFKKPPEYSDMKRYASIYDSHDDDMRAVTYRSAYNENQVITFHYQISSLKSFPYQKQLEEFLGKHNLTMSDIDPRPCAYKMEPSEYRKAERALLRKIRKKYKTVRLRGRKGTTYAYDEAIIHGWRTDVHIIELDKWVDSSEIESKEFQDELNEAIEYLRKHDYATAYNSFVRDF